MRLQPFLQWVTVRKHSSQTRTELLQSGKYTQVRIDASEVEVERPIGSELTEWPLKTAS